SDEDPIPPKGALPVDESRTIYDYYIREYCVLSGDENEQSSGREAVINGSQMVPEEATGVEVVTAQREFILTPTILQLVPTVDGPLRISEVKSSTANPSDTSHEGDESTRTSSGSSTTEPQGIPPIGKRVSAAGLISDDMNAFFAAQTQSSSKQK